MFNGRVADAWVYVPIIALFSNKWISDAWSLTLSKGLSLLRCKLHRKYFLLLQYFKKEWEIMTSRKEICNWKYYIGHQFYIFILIWLFFFLKYTNYTKPSGTWHQNDWLKLNVCPYVLACDICLHNELHLEQPLYCIHMVLHTAVYWNISCGYGCISFFSYLECCTLLSSIK